MAQTVMMLFKQLMSEEKVMRKLKFGTNFAIFVIFFGIATLEAFQTHNWLRAAFWVLIAIIFLYADSKDTSNRYT
jgi:hypothetical protein